MAHVVQACLLLARRKCAVLHVARLCCRGPRTHLSHKSSPHRRFLQHVLHCAHTKRLLDTCHARIEAVPCSAAADSTTTEQPVTKHDAGETAETVWALYGCGALDQSLAQARNRGPQNRSQYTMMLLRGLPKEIPIQKHDPNL